jgi:hypothetical protein
LAAEDGKIVVYKMRVIYFFGGKDEMYQSEIEVKEVEIAVAYGASAKAALSC